jgi:hypothetical protein
MGLDLGSLGSLTNLNPLSLVGNAVKGVVGEIIPGPIGKLVGDVAAGAIDYETGNVPGMIQDGMSALSDLPQAMQSLQQSQGGSATVSSEPSAPPPRTTTPPPGAPPAAAAAPAATGPSVEARSGVGHFAGSPPASAPPPSAPPSSSPPGTQGGLSALLLKVLDPLGLFSNILAGGGAAGGAGASAQPKLPSSAGTASSSSTKDVTSPEDSPTSSSKSSSSKSSSSKSSSASGSSKVDPSTLSKDDFMALGNDAFMQAVVQGKIPKEISDSPAAMQSLQARMNNISEMNQLMTSMLSAVHQMEMSVIQNVRV